MEEQRSRVAVLRSRLGLFGSGFLIVVLVTLNTHHVAHEQFLGAILVGFCINWVWTFNVRRVAFGSWAERLAYALGAASGTATGLILVKSLY